MDWSGVDYLWIIVMFLTAVWTLILTAPIHCRGSIGGICGLLWCFYQWFGLSFWWHPMTADDPLVSNWCNATFLQICHDEETNWSIFWLDFEPFFEWLLELPLLFTLALKNFERVYFPLYLRFMDPISVCKQWDTNLEAISIQCSGIRLWLKELSLSHLSSFLYHLHFIFELSRLIGLRKHLVTDAIRSYSRLQSNDLKWVCFHWTNHIRMSRVQCLLFWGVLDDWNHEKAEKCVKQCYYG